MLTVKCGINFSLFALQCVFYHTFCIFFHLNYFCNNEVLQESPGWAVSIHKSKFLRASL